MAVAVLQQTVDILQARTRMDLALSAHPRTVATRKSHFLPVHHAR